MIQGHDDVVHCISYGCRVTVDHTAPCRRVVAKEMDLAPAQFLAYCAKAVQTCKHFQNPNDPGALRLEGGEQP